MMCSAWPCDCAHPLMAGLGPTKVASTAPENSASIASPPALKVWVVSVTSSPRCSAKVPFSTPTSAGAWVMFGK